MGKINVLDPQIANLIAAGEVVDRPASVIKELLENSIDAGATSVTVEIKRGGISFMRVTDNGIGMSKEDVPVCIKRHATSKIHKESDLDSIMTLGFRGEALAAIGSVSTLRIMTRQKGSELGTVLTSMGGEVTEIIESGCPLGTTIIVEELFANIPARRKFLKKDGSEAMACSAVVEKIALSRPDIALKFISDGTVRFATEGDSNLKNCIYAVLGRDFAKNLVEVHGMTGGIEVLGFVGTPENIRPSRNFQNFFINGRYVKSRTAMAAIEQAFSSYIPSDKFPVCVLELKIHPALVDVNVHPSKLEVKFSNEQAVFDSVYSAIRTALQNNLPRPLFNLQRGADAGTRAKIISGFVPVKGSPEETVLGKGEQMSLQNNMVMLPEEPESKTKEESELPPHLRFAPKTEKPTPERPAPISIPKTVENAPRFEAPKTVLSAPVNRVTPNFPESTVVFTHKPQPTPMPRNSEEEAKPTEEKKDAPLFSVSSIPRRSATEAPKNVPPYKMLGEAFNSYVMVECEGKLIMIDKHAAHERILFEDMKKNLGTGADSQILLLPLLIVLAGEEMDAAVSYESELKGMGFDFDVNGKTVTVTAIPSSLTANEAEDLFASTCVALATGMGSAKVTRQIFFEQALYQASCKAAIKAGKVYDESMLRWVCERVLTDNAVRFCPHGRPVAFELSKADIEHRFKRT